MSYGKDLRKRVLEFVAEGGSKAEAARRFSIHPSTVYEWLKTPDVIEPKKTRNCTPRKYTYEQLESFIQDYPDAFLKEIASHFNTSVGSIFHSLKKMKITRKKRPLGIEKALKRPKNDENI